MHRTVGLRRSYRDISVQSVQTPVVQLSLDSQPARQPARQERIPERHIEYHNIVIRQFAQNVHSLIYN